MKIRQMIDIHTHVLPGLDDGAQTVEEALGMLRLAWEHGTRVVVASPHADIRFRYDAGRAEELLAQLRPQAPPGLELVRGCDFHLMFDNVEDALRRPAHYAINGKHYLLMELSDLTIFANTGGLWRRLEDAGLTIILTHPERNELLRQRIELVEEWVAQGRYMQVTAGSLLGAFGRRARGFAREMLDRGLVHFIASDAHDLQRRPPRLDLAWQWLAGHYSEELAWKLCREHPRAAVDGHRLDLAGFPPPKSTPAGFASWLRRAGRRPAPPARGGS